MTDNITELKIARAYVSLCAFPEDSQQVSVSLVSIGSHEIRMLGGSAIDIGSAPLFWLELFNHSTNMSVDSYRCHALKDAAHVFNDFVAQANDLNQTSPSPG